MTSPTRAIARCGASDAVEGALSALKAAGEIAGSVHLCNGQEAIPVGAAMALRPDDYITATYRGHGWALVAGVAPAASVRRGARAPVGAQRRPGRIAVLQRGGRELHRRELDRRGRGADRLRGRAEREVGEGRAGVSVVALGDGATNQGAVHEALNMAAMLGAAADHDRREQPLLRDDADLRARAGRPAGRARRCVRHRVDDRRRQRSRRRGRRRRRCGRAGPLGRRAVHRRGDDPAHRRAPHRRRPALPAARRDRTGARPTSRSPASRRRADDADSAAYDAIDVEVGAEIEAALAAAQSRSRCRTRPPSAGARLCLTPHDVTGDFCATSRPSRRRCAGRWSRATTRSSSARTSPSRAGRSARPRACTRRSVRRASSTPRSPRPPCSAWRWVRR